MKNNTRISIPQKYHCMIKELYKDEDDIWCVLNIGYQTREHGRTIHEETITGLRYELKGIKKA